MDDVGYQGSNTVAKPFLLNWRRPFDPHISVLQAVILVANWLISHWQDSQPNIF